MDFGIAFMNHPGCWEDAAFAEEHGFTSAGFVDSPLLAGDPFVAMALTARATSTMRLGSFLNVPSMRAAPATAAAISSINLLAPGRVFFGTGTGDTGRRTLGRKPVKLAQVREYVCEVRGLLAGNDVLHRDEGQDVLIRTTNPDHIRNNSEYPVPIYLAADGPLGLTITGETADGWITTLHQGRAVSTMGNAPEVFEELLRTVRESAAENGRTFDNAHTLWSTAVCVLQPGESAISPRALSQVGPIAMFAFHSYACKPEIGQFLPPPIRERLDVYEKEVLARLGIPRERFYQAVYAGHLSHLLDGEAAVLTEEIVRMISLTGTADEIAEQLGRLEAAGLGNVMLNMPPGSVRDVVLDVSKHVMPLMTRRRA